MTVHRTFTLSACAAVLILVLAGAPGGVYAQLLNPSFELPNASGGDVPGTADWDFFNQVYTTATVYHFGSQCLKTFGPFVQGGGTGARQLRPALPGQTWTGQVYALNWTADPIDNVDFGVYKIEFLNSSLQLAAGGLFGVDIFESNPINGSTPRDVWTVLGVGTAPAPPGTAYARAVIVKVDMDGAQGGSIFWDDAALIMGVEDVTEATAPLSFVLRPNAPNPFRPSTTIGFDLRRADEVDLRIYDMAGRWIATLLRARLEAGSHSALWDGTMANGEAAPAGVYCCVLQTSTGRVSRGMTLIR